MIIQNGDQLAYELLNQNIALQERSDWPFNSFDCEEWAKAFTKANPNFDYESARAWFASALMRGYDEGIKQAIGNRA